MTKWSDTAWKEAEAVYRRILAMPFVVKLADGTLPDDCFKFYLRQDALYLDGYSRILAHIASRLKRKDHVESFIRFALDGIEVERQMHASFIDDTGLSDSDMTPTCLLYTSLLKSTATGPVEVEAAATLPCFWIYQKVGEEILSKSDQVSNPYSRWITTYGDKAFAESTARAIEICDRLASEASEETRRAMTDIFVMCAKMEWMFWDSAYNLEKWKI